MSHPLAIAFLHGIGRTEPGYSDWMRQAVARRFRRLLGRESADPSAQLVFEEVNWTAALQHREDRLWTRLLPDGPMRYKSLRRFLVDFAADAIAYQPSPSDRTAYDAIHRVVSGRLARLKERAGPEAPLCVIAHSLGTVIASNFLYDLMKRERSFMHPTVRAILGDSPLELGETLTRFVTMGSPISLWSLRYPGFGRPIRIPPGAVWLNLYDPDDVIGYPLRPLN